ncbi:MAG: 6-carboxytetrahydropterin synthase QueD [Blastochloris sp.]|nr:6-carboxytetrahydropterin synthase QueD [Blastochloris sp.]
MKITLTREFTFDAAQVLDVFPEGHKCRRLHGHTFVVKISVKGQVDPATGMLYDHALILDKTKPLIEKLDHSYLNEIEGLENPTLELLCKWFWDRLAGELPGLHEVCINETPRAWCSYQGE